MSTARTSYEDDEKRQDSLDVGGNVLQKSDSEIEKEGGNLVMEVEDAAALGLKTAADGKTILVPQPSDDPKDPLNWSSTKKGLILAILALAAFGGDFQSGAGIPLLEAQGEEWGLTPTHINYAGNLNVLFLGIGGLIWIPPLYFWGRLPVLFWTQFIGTFLVLGSALAQTFEAYYVLRPLTSVFLTAGQTIGLTFIHDIYFKHLWAKKIGIWVAIFLASPYCGPFFGGFMLRHLNNEWRYVMWLVFAYSAALLVLIILFADETWYPRGLDIDLNRPTGVWGRVLNLTGVTAFRERKYKAKVSHSCLRLIEVFFKPVIFISFIVYMLSFMWAVDKSHSFLSRPSVPILTPFCLFSVSTDQRYFVDPLLDSQTFAARYVRTHQGLFRPECRLYVFFGAAVLMIIGLNIVGQALENIWNVGAVIIGWGLYVVGVMIASVAITAYALDCYPSASGEVSAAINLGRTTGGFCVGYFQLEWALKSGFDVSFGIQSAIVAIATIAVVGLVVYGERLRKWAGPLHFAQKH
ncbi:uncharacterized protein JCM6883_003894 [Sporobolomyces salmoneus]|uniref:uncharacterized protein n=1 Tax=Sporobolomyces salmoneus TaxID=183962 RepID=UPI003176BDB9